MSEDACPEMPLLQIGSDAELRNARERVAELTNSRPGSTDYILRLALVQAIERWNARGRIET